MSIRTSTSKPDSRSRVGRASRPRIRCTGSPSRSVRACGDATGCVALGGERDARQRHRLRSQAARPRRAARSRVRGQETLGIGRRTSATRPSASVDFRPGCAAVSPSSAASTWPSGFAIVSVSRGGSWRQSKPRRNAVAPRRADRRPSTANAARRRRCDLARERARRRRRARRQRGRAATTTATSRQRRRWRRKGAARRMMRAARRRTRSRRRNRCAQRVHRRVPQRSRRRMVSSSTALSGEALSCERQISRAPSRSPFAQSTSPRCAAISASGRCAMARRR